MLDIEINEYPCPHCPASFSNSEARTMHYIETHEGAGPSVPGPNMGMFHCRHCGRSKSHKWLSQHLQKDRRCKRIQERWIQQQIVQSGVSPRRSRRRANAAELDICDDHSDNSHNEAIQGRNIGVMSDDEAYAMRDVSVTGRAHDSDIGDANYPSDQDSIAESQAEIRDSDAESNAGLTDIPSDYSRPRSRPPSPGSRSLPRNPSLRSVEMVELVEEVDLYGRRVYVERYKIPTVGEPIRRATAEELSRGNYPDVGQLSDRQSFEIAQVLMESGMSGKYRDKCLRLRKFRPNSPWPNNRAMIKDIDKLPRGAGWSVQALKITGDQGIEIVELWLRDAWEIVKRLLRNKRLGKFMQFKPIKKWTSPERTEQIRDDIHTADWMWEVQGEIKDEFGTVIPIIISSDETKLTNFSGDKKAHPVYLTIGNLPKRLHRRTSKRANILLGYLPVPKLDCETNAAARRLHRRNLFHGCMRALLAPLAKAAETGVEVVCADGGVRRVYPVLAAYIADFVEQCKVACIKQTHCPLCEVNPKKKGDLGNAPLRNHDKVTKALDDHRGPGSARFERLGLYDVEPFWRDYPYLQLEYLMTPDLLHQLHKGVMKDHLTKWVTEILGKQVFDERHTAMPEYHGMRHFKHGITSVSQWTGRELKEMAKVLLPAVSDQDERVVAAARALLDFMYLAHSSALTDSDLAAMERSLRMFHHNKSVFKQLGALKTREAFHGIPKIHMIQHYVKLIQMLGTPDGYNTEMSERLHIDFAKMGYRASNRVNAIKQMALYIQRVEAIAMHAEHLQETGAEVSGTQQILQYQLANELEEEADDEWDEWLEEEEEEEDPDELRDAGVRQELAVMLDEFLNGKRARVGGRWEQEPAEPGEQADQGPQRFHPVPDVVVAKTPTSSLTLDAVQRQNNAPQLCHSLELYLRRRNPEVRLHEIRQLVPPTTKVNTWSRARLFHAPPPFKPSEGPHVDAVRAQPVKLDRFERVSRPARFDTVLIRSREQRTGVHRTCQSDIVQLVFEPFSNCPDASVTFAMKNWSMSNFLIPRARTPTLLSAYTPQLAPYRTVSARLLLFLW
ncbi:plasma membrane ATPase 4 [Ceratobasidium sp. AG-Ba]|nr:plasma membrane ATPase 4 [Ceratobasidium sp. AG-Ba]